MPANPDCLFCKIVDGTVSSEIIAEDERTIAFMDIAPATRGHLLVIPRAHGTDIRDIDPEDLAATHVAAQRMAKLVTKRLNASGVNILQSSGKAAWQTVFHFHVHVIPRYEHDPLRLPWDPEAKADKDIGATADELR